MRAGSCQAMEQVSESVDNGLASAGALRVSWVVCTVEVMGSVNFTTTAVSILLSGS